VSRLVIPAAIVTKYETAAGMLRVSWMGRADSGAFDRARAAIALTHALPDFCYWNAAAALLLDPALRHARYVEGVLAIDGPMVGQKDASNLRLECQGWLELPDGRIADPTLFAGHLEAAPERGRDRALYVPVLRLTREELVGLGLPRMMYEPTLCVRTFEAINAVMLPLGAAAGTAPLGLRRALRLFAFTLAVPWLSFREGLAARLTARRDVA
jgi:hypothetical protein